MATEILLFGRVGTEIDAKRLALAESEFNSQFSIVMGFNNRIERPNDCCAVLNEDRKHAVSWLGFQDSKSGRVGSDVSVIVAQMSPEWTTSHYDSCDDVLSRNPSSRCPR